AHEQPITKRDRGVKLITDAEVGPEQHLPRAVLEDVEAADVGAGDDLLAQLAPGEGRFADDRQPQDHRPGKIDLRLARRPRARVEFAEAVLVVLVGAVAAGTAVDVIEAQVAVGEEEQLIAPPVRRAEDYLALVADLAGAVRQQAVADPHGLL